jgi:putative copper export protein
VCIGGYFPRMIESAGGLFAIALRGAALFGTITVIGGWAFARFVVARVSGPAVDPYRASLAQFSNRLAMAGAALVAALMAPRAIGQAFAAASSADPTGPLVLAVLKSPWGIALVLQALAAALVFLGLRFASVSRLYIRLTDAGIAVLLVAPAFLGHAAADPDRALASIIVSTLHVAAAGGWIGALLVLTLLARTLRTRDEGGPLIASLIVAFHPLALASAGIVFATGLATAWLRMGAPEGIANSTYSGLFVIKVVLVFVTGAVGAGHAKQAKRRVTTVDRTAISRTLLGEALLAMLVLLVTAVLTGTAPIG